MYIGKALDSLFWEVSQKMSISSICTEGGQNPHPWFFVFFTKWRTILWLWLWLWLCKICSIKCNVTCRAYMYMCNCTCNMVSLYHIKIFPAKQANYWINHSNTILKFFARFWIFITIQSVSRLYITTCCIEEVAEGNQGPLTGFSIAWVAPTL